MSNSQYSTGAYKVWKAKGETLAALLVRVRNEEKLSDSIKMTYAGRLDPMAEGIVPILAGDARFKKEDFNGLSKTYELSVLLGVQSDTGDMLGVLEKVDLRPVSEEEIKNIVLDIAHITELPYPMYSSRPVEGVPLFVHARAGREVNIPIKKVALKDVEYLGVESVKLSKLIDDSITIIKKVEGDFRQDEIIQKWIEIKKEKGDEHVLLMSIRVTVSSGTYMRSLAEWIGKELGVPALAYAITRTAIEHSGILNK